MSHTNANTHLTLEERRIILTGIKNGSTKTAIAKTIGKDNSTVGKEIRLHRSLSHKCSLPMECSDYKSCAHGRNCTADCPDFAPPLPLFQDGSLPRCLQRMRQVGILQV